MEGEFMRKEYDFSGGKLNPYIKNLRKQISIRLDIDTIEYFKRQAKETETIPKFNKYVPK
jgi:uncharacterized protein (DUF4415 family)